MDDTGLKTLLAMLVNNQLSLAGSMMVVLTSLSQIERGDPEAGKSIETLYADLEDMLERCQAMSDLLKRLVDG